MLPESLRKWLPESCSRMRVFLSYSHQDKAIAEEVAQALKNDGHTVFFDAESLPPAGDYNEQIRTGIESADRAVFLASKASLAQGKYTLTELELVKKRWPSAEGRVFTVLLEPDAKAADLPVYLRSVHVISVVGNVAAEIAAALDGTRQINSWCKACVLTSSLAILAVAAFGTWQLTRPPLATTDVVLGASEWVHFRPRAKPPERPLEKDAPTQWLTSPVTVTNRVSYSHRAQRAAGAQVLSEELELQLGSTNYKYNWAYVVEILSDKPCADWLCQKSNAGPENLKPGQTTPPRETMFLPAGNAVNWGEFIDAVLSPDGPTTLKVVQRSRLAVAASGKTPELVRESVCMVDLARARQRFIERGFVPKQNPRPQFWQPNCVKS